MRDIAWIVLKDLRQQIRDRTVLIFGLIAPLVIAAALSLAFGSVLQTDETVVFEFGMSSADGGGAISESFATAMAGLEQQGLMGITFHRDRASLDRAVENKDLDAGFFIPDGFSQAIIEGSDARIVVIANPDSPVVAGVATAIAEQFSLEVASAGAAGATVALLGGLSPEQMVEVGLVASLAPPPAQVASVEATIRRLDGPTYYSAGAAMFFIMFVVGTGVLSLMEERKRHTLARLLSSPIAPGKVLTAKYILSFVVGVASVGLFMLFSRFLLGANWTDPPVTALLVVTATAAATGIVTLVAGLARTPEQAQSFQSVVAVTFGILGGAFFPVAAGNPILGALSMATPHAWFLRGLGDLSGGGGLQIVALPLVVMTGIAVLTLTFSVLGARRSLRA